MATRLVPTRRALLKAGALAAAPLGAGASAAVQAHEDLQRRTERLEDEAAIRALHEALLRQVNTGGLADVERLFASPDGARVAKAMRSIAPDHTGEADAVDVAADGLTATGRFHCSVEIESVIPPTCTLAQMAHAQGGGFVRRTARHVLTSAYAKADGAWMITRLDLTPG